MKKIWLYALAGAIGVTGLAETAPQAQAESGSAAPRTLEQLRENARANAMTALATGGTEQVRHRRWHRKRYVAPRRYSMRYVHRRGHWCGKKALYGRRCYYTPRILKPFRQR